MKEQFLNLRKLQEIDLELKTLRERLNKIPRQIEELNRSFQEIKSSLDSKKHELTEHKKQHKLAEVDLHATEEKITTYSVQLFSLKTNEQYKALLKEIETQKKVKAEIEDRLITLMEETEQLEKEIKKLEKTIGEIEDETRRKIAGLEAEKDEINKAIAEREKFRNEITRQLSPELLNRYERIRTSKGGIAVTTTENERCNGCLSPIPPQKILEIERADRIYLCETCGRILLPTEIKIKKVNE